LKYFLLAAVVVVEEMLQLVTVAVVEVAVLLIKQLL
jgi:hypothetical protein